MEKSQNQIALEHGLSPATINKKDDWEGHRAQQSTGGHMEREDSVCRLVSSDMVD